MENVLAVGDTITAEETMTSVEIAEITGKQHQHITRDIDNLLSQGVGASNFGLISYIDKMNREQRAYQLTKKGCLILASGYDAVLREKIIDRWEQLETEKRNGGFIIPKTLSQALLLASKQAEQIEQQQKLLDIQKPKVEFFDSVADSKTAIPMNDVAKVLAIKGFGRNNLFEFLRNRKILMNNNRPYQKYVDSGYFRVVEQHYQKNGEEQISFKTLVYQRGIDFIRRTLQVA
jgi:anti-repressor protein